MWEKNFLFLNEDATIQFNGRCTMPSGVSLILDLGILEIGENFFCNKNCTISCNDKITIGDHVWVAAFSHILKNSNVPDGSVVAYHSLVTKSFEGEKLLLGGCPAKVIEEQIEWEQ